MAHMARGGARGVDTRCPQHLMIILSHPTTSVRIEQIWKPRAARHLALSCSTRRDAPYRRAGATETLALRRGTVLEKLDGQR